MWVRATVPSASTGVYHVVVVKDTKPVAQPVADGIDWADIGLGAGGVMALSLIALGGGLIVVHRRGARQLPV
jgi:hypothetical protein